MYKQANITIEEALKIEDKIFIDVRSPSEYNDYHIPNALNIPILNDTERHEIGIIHKNEGPVSARRTGLKFVSPKLTAITDQLIEISKESHIILYCARGGMRSQSVSRILDLVKVKHSFLSGGYKAYRNHVIKYLESYPKNEIVVLHGLTGVGKTLILKELQKTAPIIDIEGLANHRGSAFGSVGLGKQPSQKMFESLLYNEVRKNENSTYTIVECESRRTGKLSLPQLFFDKMKNGIHIHVYTTIEKRIERIVAEYGPNIINEEELADSIKKLNRSLGNSKVEYLLDCLKNKEIEELVRVLLVDYYDPLYGYSSEPDDKYQVNICADNISKAAKEIKEWCDNSIRV